MGKKARLDARKLRKAFRENLRQGWEHGRELHPEETPYAFVLYGVEGTPKVSLHVLTEEALAEVADRYVSEGYYETHEEACEKLRYSIEDSLQRLEKRPRRCRCVV